MDLEHTIVTESEWLQARREFLKKEKASTQARDELNVGVISWLEEAERLLTEGFVLQRTLVFGFGHDEEIGGNAGAAMIAARLREMGMHFEWMVDEGSVILESNPMAPGRPATRRQW